MTPKELDDLIDVCAVSEALREAQAAGLECELVLSALRAMQSEHRLSIPDALKCALAEWDI